MKCMTLRCQGYPDCDSFPCPECIIETQVGETTMSRPLTDRQIDELAKADRILELVRAELHRAIIKHRPMHSPHEGSSVIREEFEELWDHVKADTGQTQQAFAEAIQIAAMGVRYVTDLSGPSDFAA